jgi:hypothetical protein
MVAVRNGTTVVAVLIAVAIATPILIAPGVHLIVTSRAVGITIRVDGDADFGCLCGATDHESGYSTQRKLHHGTAH